MVKHRIITQVDNNNVKGATILRLATQKATAPNAKHINMNHRVREETINNLENNYNESLLMTQMLSFVQANAN